MPAHVTLVVQDRLRGVAVASCLDYGGYDIVGHVASRDDLLRQFETRPSELVLLSADFPEPAQFALCREIVKRWPATRVVLFSNDANDQRVQADAAIAGALACLSKELDCNRLRASLASALTERPLLTYAHRFPHIQPVPLTPREHQVARHLADGLTSVEIAQRIGTRPKTIDNHARRILTKLDVHSRAEAVRRAQRLGWL